MPERNTRTFENSATVVLRRAGDHVKMKKPAIALWLVEVGGFSLGTLEEHEDGSCLFNSASVWADRTLVYRSVDEFIGALK